MTNRIVTLATAMTILSSAGGMDSASAQQFNWSQVPRYINVASRISDVEQQILEALATGQLTRTRSDEFLQTLRNIRSLDQNYRKDGKLSIWERMKLVVDLDNLEKSVQLSLTKRQVAVTDVPARMAELSGLINDSVVTGRMTASEAQSFNEKLAGIRLQEKSYRADGALTNTELLSLSLSLDRLNAEIENGLRTRVIADPGLSQKRRQLRMRIRELVSAGKLTEEQAAALRRELRGIRGKEMTFKVDGQLNSDETLTLALDIDQLKTRIDAFAPEAVPAGIQGLDAKKEEIKKAISDAQSKGNLTVQQAGDFAQEFDRIEALEALFRKDGSLTDSEILTLARDLDALKKETADSIAKAPDQAPGLAERMTALRKRIENARATNRIETESLARELLAELDRIELKATFYKEDGLNDTETLILAHDLDFLNNKFESLVKKLPNIQEVRAAIEQDLTNALASGRLTVKKAEEIRGELNRVSFLENTFKSGDGLIDDRETVALNREYERVRKRLLASLPALPDLDKIQSSLEKQIAEAESSETLSAAHASELKREFSRIAGVEATFRASNPDLPEWQVMSLKGDLDRLASDLERYKKEKPLVKVEIDSSKVAFDVRGHWAEKYVAVLQQRGTIGGFPDGSFKPDSGITRAQFAAIAAKALGLPAAGRDAKFNDLPRKHWAFKAVSAVADAGLVGGYPDGSYRPEDKITRTQAFVILSKALKSASKNPEVLKRFKDGNKVPTWAIPAVSKAANSNILVNHPDPYKIRPLDQATRAEVAALTYQTMARLGTELPLIRIGLEASGD